jgi:glucokinase
MTTYLMTGDIGGTNSRMSLYESHTSCEGKNQPLLEKKFRNHDALPDNVRSDPNAFSKYIIIPFLEYCWQQQEQDDSSDADKKKKKVSLVPLNECTIFCCLATAGVVHENQVEMTNIGNLKINGNNIQGYHRKDTKRSPMNDDPLLINNKYLARIVQCHIVNDFVAQGYGCLTLSQADVLHLYGPKIAPQDLIKGPKVCVGAGTGLGECYLTQSMGEGMYTVRTIVKHCLSK